MPFNLLYDYYSRTRHASGYHAQPGGTFYIKCVILSLVAKPSLGFIRAVSKDMVLIFYLIILILKNLIDILHIVVKSLKYMINYRIRMFIDIKNHLLQRIIICEHIIIPF